MKIKHLATVLTLAMALAARANIYNYDFSGLNTVIPDGDEGGVTDSHTLSGTTGTILDVSVTLDISGGYNGDYFGYLVSDAGYAVLLNRVGRDGSNPYGLASSGMNVTFSENAASDIHLATAGFGSTLTGTYKSDGRTTSPYSVVSGDSRSATLSSFTGGSANGTWTLLLADVSPVGEGSLNGWTLQVATTPEPVTWALIIFGTVLCGMTVRRWRLVRQAQ